MVSANITEFQSQRNKMPGDLENICAVGPYIIEHYSDAIGSQRNVLEINEKDSEGNYSKVDSVWFDSKDEAIDAYTNLKNGSKLDVEELFS